MSEDALSVSLDCGSHALLSSFVASWLETARTWFRPNELADESSALGSYDATDSAVGIRARRLALRHPARRWDEYLGVETRYGAGIDRAQPYSLA